MMNFAVFASGGGSNFQALLDRVTSGDLHARFTVLITNSTTAGACDRARTHQIPVAVLPPSRFADETVYLHELTSVLDAYKVEAIVLAGYMKKLPAPIVTRFRNRIVNIHPGLIPAFCGKGMYGSHVHQAVIDYGAKLSGVTVHFVDEEYDNGPIILQEAVPVLDTDDAHSLAERVLQAEHDHYWRAVEDVAQNRLRVENRRVIRHV